MGFGPLDLHSRTLEPGNVPREQWARILHSREEGPRLLPIVPPHLLGENDPAPGKDATDFCRVHLLVSIEDQAKHVVSALETTTVGTPYLDRNGGRAAPGDGSVPVPALACTPR